MILQTDRLVLRPVTLADTPRLLEIANRPGVRDYLLPGQASEAQTRRWVEQAVAHAETLSGLHFGFMILQEDPATPVGVCALNITSRSRRLATVGWEIDPDHAGNGYATEAATALVRLGFGACGVRRIRSECYRDNAGSRRVMEKVGLKEKRAVWDRVSLWWSYPDTRSKVRYEAKKNAWLRERA